MTYLFDKWMERYCNAPTLKPDFTTHITGPWVAKENQQNGKVSESDTERFGSVPFVMRVGYDENHEPLNKAVVYCHANDINYGTSRRLKDGAAYTVLVAEVNSPVQLKALQELRDL